MSLHKNQAHDVTLHSHINLCIDQEQLVVPFKKVTILKLLNRTKQSQILQITVLFKNRVNNKSFVKNKKKVGSIS